MSDVRVDEQLWVTSMLPEGFVERWFVDDGGWVMVGDRIAEVRVEGCSHEIIATDSGRLKIWSPRNSVIEPGSRIGVLER